MGVSCSFQKEAIWGGLFASVWEIYIYICVYTLFAQPPTANLIHEGLRYPHMGVIPAPTPNQPLAVSLETTSLPGRAKLFFFCVLDFYISVKIQRPLMRFSVFVLFGSGTLHNSYCNTFFWCSPSIHAPTQPRMSLFAVGWVFLHDSCNARDPRAKASWKLVRWVSSFFFGVYQTQQDWRIGSCSKYSFIDKLDEESSLVVSFFPLIFRSRTMPPCCSSGSSPEFLAVPLSPAPHRQGW